MTGAEFETTFTKWLFEKGFWALNIPRNKFGAQPFDIIAIKGNVVWAIDCKVCGEKRLDMRRVEPNQYTAFELMQERTKARCSFVCLHENVIYEIQFDDVKDAYVSGRSSIKLEHVIARFNDE